MTNDELKQYYANLLILQYLSKPKARAQVEVTVEPLVMNQLPIQVQNAFQIGLAEGVQLDVLGKYVGVSRSGYGLEGQPITLNDTDYTTLIKLLIIENNSGSSLSTIQGLLASTFPGEIFITDSTNMSLNYLIKESLGSSDLLELIVTGNYLPRPMAVAISIVIVPAIDFPFFGFYKSDDPGASIAGFNFYESYSFNTPWLGY